MSTTIKGLPGEESPSEDGIGRKSMAGAVADIVDRIRAELEALPEALGAVLHGSHAQGTAREDSDVDLICVTDGTWYSKEIRLIDGFEVEIQKIPHDQIRYDLEKMKKPFTVRAFAACRILFDRNGVVADLCATADELWRRGAPPPTETEILFGKSYLRHHLEELERLMEDPEGNRVAVEGVLAETLLMTLRAYFRARGRWPNKVSTALRQIREIDPEFWSLCERYGDARELPEKIAVMREMVEGAIEPVGTLVVEYETPRVPAQFSVLRAEAEVG